jgi:multiple sugar transport system substrate-binding protein
MIMKRKRILMTLLCFVILATMAFAGCGGNSGGDTTDSGSGTAEQSEESGTSGSTADFDWKAYDGTTINVMFNEHNYSKAVIAKIEDFQNLTGITVKYSSTPEENYFDKLNTALSSKSGNPDVFMTGAYQVWEYAPAGYCEPLENYISDSSKTDAAYNFDDFYPSVVNALRWDMIPGHAVGEGSQWALPMGWEINDLAYNKKLFDEKNISVPTTTDELLETAKSLKEWGGSGSYGVALRGTRNWATIHPGYMSLFSTWGGKDFEIQDGKLVCQLDSKEAIEMTDYWVKLIKEGSTPQWSNYTWYQAGADLGAGKAAMLFDATCNGYFQNVPDASAESGNIAWTTIPLPAGKTEADMKANIWIWSLAMNADSKNKDAAWYFIQYFTSPDYMLYAGTEGSSPDTPRKSVGDSDEYKSVVGKSVGYLESIETLLPNATIQFTPQPYFFECTTEWAATLQDLVTGDKYASTEEGMKELTEKLNKVVADLPVEG